MSNSPDYKTLAIAARKLGFVGKEYSRKNLSRGQKSYLTKIHNKFKDQHENLFIEPDKYHIHKVGEKSKERLKLADFEVINSRVIIKKHGKNEGLRIRTLKTQTNIYTWRKEKGKKHQRYEEHFTPVFDDPLKIYVQIAAYEKIVKQFGHDPDELAASGAPFPFLQVKVAGYISQPFDSITELKKYLSKFSEKTLRYITLVKRTWEEIEGEDNE